MPLELLWIGAGVGLAIGPAFLAGFWTGLRHTPQEMRALTREVDDTLDKLAHQVDRARKRVNNGAAATSAADRESATGAEGVSGVDRKSAIRRRAIEQGVLRLPTLATGRPTQ